MKSIWMEDGHMPNFPPLRGDHQTDVLVIGGGMAGLLCAYQLRLAGVNCVVAEAKTLAGGITKDTTAKLTVQHGLIYRQLIDRFGGETARMYLEANLRALEEFKWLCQGIDCDFTPQDSYIYTTARREKLEKELSALEDLGYPAQLAEGLPLPFPTLGAVKVPNQAQFHPLKFMSAIAEELLVYESTPVRRLEKGMAITDRGQIRAKAIIVATHFPFLNTHGSYFLKLYQQRSYVLSLKGVTVPQGMYLDEAENGLSFRGWGDHLLLGGGGHRTGKPGGGWQELETVSRIHYPQAVITHRWATQDCMSLDGIPYIGRYSARTPELYVATGFNKWGMTSAMAAAQILRELITTGDSPYARVFSPSRHMLHPQLMTNALEAVGNLLSFSTKRCPHMGCALKWNAQEHSWDCPCHGSRFDQDGRLIDNPATSDRKK